MPEFAVWAPRPEPVRLDVDGAAHPMTRGRDGWWRATVDAAPTLATDSSSTTTRRCCPIRAPRASPTACTRRSQLWEPASQAWTDDGWRGRSVRGRGDLRAAHRHVHAGGHLRLGDREAGPPGRSRRRLRRGDAGQRVLRHARLGLRRRAVVRRARTLRRTRRPGPSRRRLPSPWPGRADRRGVQPSRPVGQLPAPVRAVPVVGEQPVGRRHQHRRRRLRRGAPLHHRLRAALDARLPRRRAAPGRRARAGRHHRDPPFSKSCPPKPKRSPSNWAGRCR